MSDGGLQRALRDGLTPPEWYRILNSKVFFWPSERRLNSMLGAQAYRDREHLVLVVSTEALLERHSDRVLLSRLNSGATKPFPHKRGKDCFLPMGSYPYWERVRRGLDPVAEVAVPSSVPDISELVVTVGIANGSFDNLRDP